MGDECARAQPVCGFGRRNLYGPTKVPSGNRGIVLLDELRLIGTLLMTIECNRRLTTATRGHY